MSELVDHLADLTAHRDRDLLDASLAGALSEMLAPLWLAVHRRIGQEGAECWLTRARWSRGDVAATADSLWTSLDELPALEARPAWQDCLHKQVPHFAEGSPSTALFPLFSDGGAVGVLELCTEHPLATAERRSVASLLRLYRNFQGLLDYSQHDTLTGLLNRKTFDASFLRLTPPGGEVNPPNTERRSVDAAAGTHYLGLIDVDHFKRVNDGFGHLIGDEVLLLLSRLMRGTFRHHDRLYRFGGEEFVALLRCADEASAAIAFERLRVNVEQFSFPQVGHITISIGYTAVVADDSPSRAFERADRAVYFAKGNGRNQVRSHAALIAAALLQDEQKAGAIELF